MPIPFTPNHALFWRLSATICNHVCNKLRPWFPQPGSHRKRMPKDAKGIQSLKHSHTKDLTSRVFATSLTSWIHRFREGGSLRKFLHIRTKSEKTPLAVVGRAAGWECILAFKVLAGFCGENFEGHVVQTRQSAQVGHAVENWFLKFQAV